MSAYVVDASVAAKWFLEEELTDHARRVLRPGNRLYAPDFFLLEIDSLFCRRVRRRDISATEAEDARARLRLLPIEYHGFGTLRDRAFEMAVRTRRSPYDCLYVVLAILLDGQMVTADSRFYTAMAGGPFSDRIIWVADVG